METLVETKAPALLPMWLRHGHKVPENLASDLSSGGVSNFRIVCALKVIRPRIILMVGSARGVSILHAHLSCSPSVMPIYIILIQESVRRGRSTRNLAVLSLAKSCFEAFRRAWLGGVERVAVLGLRVHECMDAWNFGRSSGEKPEQSRASQINKALLGSRSIQETNCRSRTRTHDGMYGSSVSSRQPWRRGRGDGGRPKNAALVLCGLLRPVSCDACRSYPTFDQVVEMRIAAVSNGWTHNRQIALRGSRTF